MSTEIISSELVEELYEFYEEQLLARMTFQATGAQMPTPTNAAQKANLLNVALFDPHAVIAWGGDLSSSQLSIWQPYLSGSRYRFAVVCLSNKGRNQAAMGLQNVPIYSIRDGFQHKAFLPVAKNMAALLYPINHPHNFAYMRNYPSFMHVHIGHGDSDKHSSGSRLGIAYDFILLANANAIARFSHNSVEVQPASFLPMGGTVVPGAVLQRESGNIENILFAPTSEGKKEATNFSSLARAFNQIKLFAQENPGKFLARFHPGTGGRDKSYIKRAKFLKQFYAGSSANTKGESFNWSDAIVTDISGVMSEYLFTGKPIIVPISRSDGWLYAYLKASGISKYVYAWNYKKIPLQDFLVSIAEDPLQAARLSRRDSIFFGVENFAQSQTLFDEAMSYVIESRKMRIRRQGNNEWARVNGSGLTDPTDKRLKEIVENVRAGKAMLRANDIDVQEIAADAAASVVQKDLES